MSERNLLSSSTSRRSLSTNNNHDRSNTCNYRSWSERGGSGSPPTMNSSRRTISDRSLNNNMPGGGNGGFFPSVHYIDNIRSVLFMFALGCLAASQLINSLQYYDNDHHQLPIHVPELQDGMQRRNLLKHYDTPTTAESRKNEKNEKNTKKRSRSTPIPLLELVQTDPETSCHGEEAENLVLVNDTITSAKMAYSTRTIPKIVHITSKSRCVHKGFYSHLEKWMVFPDHAFFFHNEAAVDRLLEKDWPEFPLLPQIVHCLKSGAAKIDLWRALLLYEYGGIYTDMDNAPAAFNGTLDDNDEAFFVVEQGGYLSQYFFAAAPKHPLMWQLVHGTMMQLYTLRDVSKQYVPQVTGPGSLKNAFIHFMSDQGTNQDKDHEPEFRRVTAGHYTGFHNATVTVVGTKENSNEYVKREAVKSKKAFFKRMNMTHFTDVKKEREQGLFLESCIQRIYNRQMVPDHWQQLKTDIIYTATKADARW